MVRVEREGEDDLRIAVDGGFLSVTEQSVTVLAESLLNSDSEIDEPPRSATPNRRSRYRRKGRASFAPWARSTRGPADERVHDAMVALVVYCCSLSSRSFTGCGSYAKWAGQRDPARCAPQSGTRVAPRVMPVTGVGSRLLCRPGAGGPTAGEAVVAWSRCATVARGENSTS